MTDERCGIRRTVISTYHTRSLQRAEIQALRGHVYIHKRVYARHSFKCVRVSWALGRTHLKGHLQGMRIVEPLALEPLRHPSIRVTSSSTFDRNSLAVAQWWRSSRRSGL
jgi:hypothetical protein